MKNLAIAYNLSRHNKKKMAQGGKVEVDPQAEAAKKLHDREGRVIPEEIEKASQVSKSFKSALGFADGGEVENEDLHPMHEVHSKAKEMVMHENDLSKHAQSHETLAHPEEMHEHVEPKAEDMPNHMFYGPKKIAGDIVKRRMAKGGMCYAEGGVVNDDRTEMEMEEPEYGNDTYPDPDNMEHTEGMDMPKRKMILSNIMRGIRSRHMGK